MARAFVQCRWNLAVSEMMAEMIAEIMGEMMAETMAEMMAETMTEMTLREGILVDVCSGAFDEWRLTFGSTRMQD